MADEGMADEGMADEGMADEGMADEGMVIMVGLILVVAGCAPKPAP